ncbi:hypothetical protein Q1695_011543 [Nippostrongylus brasiliensis]|nr:hypothetical protein Q1695_011543 [Nippostrongylus brasiliensis]
MASAVVVGEGKLAAFITKLLCSCGTPVALYGAGKPIRESIESMLQKHVEETFPLQFVDDLRHQQDMVARLMENLRMTDDVSRLHGEVIIDATHNPNSALLRAVRRFVPDAPVMSLNGNVSDQKTISVHLYEPFEITRIAQFRFRMASSRRLDDRPQTREMHDIFRCSSAAEKSDDHSAAVQGQIMPSSTADESSLARIRTLLAAANIAEINAEQGDVAQRALSEWRDQDTSTPQLERVIASIVPARSHVHKPSYLQSVMH